MCFRMPKNQNLKPKKMTEDLKLKGRQLVAVRYF